jgi:hypothetical protein
MRKLLVVGLTFALILGSLDTVWAQFNTKGIKHENRRIAGYRGTKSKFGKEKIYNSVGVSLNLLNYYGDLAPSPSSFSTDLSFTKPGFGLSFTHRFGPRYSLRQRGRQRIGGSKRPQQRHLPLPKKFIVPKSDS